MTSNPGGRFQSSTVAPQLSATTPALDDSRAWYKGITPYQWLVLTVACLGWIFDAFEGQLFVASMNEAMPSLLPAGASAGEAAYYNNLALGAFLVGGALGGGVFGVLGDRIGRAKAMIFTILVYSLFTGLSGLAQNWWQMVLLRFLVAMGVAGEWAVAGALVAEVFPPRSRAWSLAIFQASSVFGCYFAVAVGALVVANRHWGWRWGFGVGLLPALLTIWIRCSLREPDAWMEARRAARQDQTKQVGNIAELFSGKLLRATLVAVALGTIGLATYWGVHIYGRDLLRAAVERQYVARAGALSQASSEEQQPVLAEHFQAIKRSEMLGMFLVNTGCGLGLLCFGPIADLLGRRGAFWFFLFGGFAAAIVLFQWLSGFGPPVLWVALPVFGFLTGGMHTGCAICFPEMFPTRLRSTGTGFSYNGGRLLAAPVLVASGWMRNDLQLGLNAAASILSGLFLVGAAVVLLMPETRGRELPT